MGFMDHLNKKIEIKLSHALLKSSHDFILSAINYTNKDDENSFKFAILHLTSAIELLLKSRLADEHWSLVFADPDKATTSNLHTGNFLSVDIDTSQKRLKQICNIELSSADKGLIENIKKIRNKIIHFHIVINKNIIKGLTARCLNTYIEFYNTNIAPVWEDYSVFGYELTHTLSQFKEFVMTRMESLSIGLKNSNRPKTNFFWECQNCLQDAIIITEENKLQCLFCGDIREIADTAEAYSKDDTVNTCPSCHNKSYIMTSIKNDQKNFECIICGHFEGVPQVWVDLSENRLPHLRDFSI